MITNETAKIATEVRDELAAQRQSRPDGGNDHFTVEVKQRALRAMDLMLDEGMSIGPASKMLGVSHLQVMTWARPELPSRLARSRETEGGSSRILFRPYLKARIALVESPGSHETHMHVAVFASVNATRGARGHLAEALGISLPEMDAICTAYGDVLDGHDRTSPPPSETDEHVAWVAREFEVERRWSTHGGNALPMTLRPAAMRALVYLTQEKRFSWSAASRELGANYETLKQWLLPPDGLGAPRVKIAATFYRAKIALLEGSPDASRLLDACWEVGDGFGIHPDQLEKIMSKLTAGHSISPSEPAHAEKIQEAVNTLRRAQDAVTAATDQLQALLDQSTPNTETT